MTDPHLRPLVTGDEIASELRRRKKKDISKSVTGSTKKLIAKKVRLEEADGACFQEVRQVHQDSHAEAC